MKLNFQKKLEPKSSIPSQEFERIRKSRTKVILKIDDSSVDLLHSIIFKKFSLVKKIWLAFKLFVLVHIFACSLNILEMIIQNLYNHYCFLTPICFCYNDFGVKIYVLVKTTLNTWMFEAFMMYNTIFFIRVVNKIKWFKIFYWLASFSIITFFHLTEDGKSYAIYQKVYETVLILYFFYGIFIFIKMRYNCRSWYQIFLKSNLINLLFIMNWAFVNYLHPIVKQNVQSKFSLDSANNLLSLLVAIYSFFFKFAIQKFCWFYYQNLYTESHNEEFNNIRISIFFRFSYCYYVAMNVVVILNMSLYNWGGWILIFNYICFLIKSYSNWDIIDYFIWKIKVLLFKKNPQKKIHSPRYLEFKKIFSGCSLDIQIICVMRLMVMYFWRRWSIGSGFSSLYKNCNFEITDAYEMNFLGIEFLIGANILILAVLMKYMKSKKIALFSYKPYFLSANVFMFFSLNFLMESQFQMGLSYIANL